jgi:hypothetical protein
MGRKWSLVVLDLSASLPPEVTEMAPTKNLAKSKTKEQREWTIMVYYAGDNNLSAECVYALNEMKNVVGLDQFYLLVQFDPNDPFLPTHRYLITDDGKVATLPANIIDRASFDPEAGEVFFQRESENARQLAKTRQEGLKQFSKISNAAKAASFGTAPDPNDGSIDDTDTASPITLYNFLSFCMNEYPARHYLPVIAGHGAGTQRDYLLRDSTPDGYLTLNELKLVFRKLRRDRGKPFEILGMDNCLMSMGEICYELRGSVETIVGCESFSPSSGWPFREILERLRDIQAAASKKPVTRKFAEAIVEEYTTYYANYWLGGLSVAQSAMNILEVEKFKEDVDAFADALVQELEREESRKAARSAGKAPAYPFRDALVLAHWEAQSYNGERFADLFDFCDCLEKRSQRAPIVTACRRIKKSIESFVLKSCYNGAAYQHSHGVSLYFPWSQVGNSYMNLDFVRSGVDGVMQGWGKFLEAYTAKTRRAPRGMEASELNRGSSNLMTGPPAIGQLVRKTSDMKTSDMKTSDMGGSDIVSMRNPPVVFVPDECIHQTRSIIAAQRKLLISSAPTPAKRKRGAVGKRGKRKR